MFWLRVLLQKKQEILKFWISYVFECGFLTTTNVGSGAFGVAAWVVVNALHGTAFRSDYVSVERFVHNYFISLWKWSVKLGYVRQCWDFYPLNMAAAKWPALISIMHHWSWCDINLTVLRISSLLSGIFCGWKIMRRFLELVLRISYFSAVNETSEHNNYVSVVELEGDFGLAARDLTVRASVPVVLVVGVEVFVRFIRVVVAVRLVVVVFLVAVTARYAWNACTKTS